MTADEKLALILAAIQTDPGDRGLARVPGDNLFTACGADFAAACGSIARHPSPAVEIVTGFYIPGATPPAFETDGPLGSWFLARALAAIGIPAAIRAEDPVMRALGMGTAPEFAPTHRVAVERSGPAGDGEHYTMRGKPIGAFLDQRLTPLFAHPGGVTTVGIGDGGNEIGMGRVPAETVAANVPGGAKVHCTVPTDFLIVAGVSNWGAYALAAGVTLLRGGRWPHEWAERDTHRAELARQVTRGPLVDGVRGVPEPTVDGLPWEAYCDVLARIHRVLNG